MFKATVACLFITLIAVIVHDSQAQECEGKMNLFIYLAFVLLCSVIHAQNNVYLYFNVQFVSTC